MLFPVHIYALAITEKVVIESSLCTSGEIVPYIMYIVSAH